ncbi:unnamed protein product [Alopecurus aequalis]
MCPRRQCSKKKAGATPPALLLPRDVLASILVRLPGADLRRLRRVCKEWRDIISDPTFIQEHMVYTPKLPPTHTIVFFPGFTYGSHQDPRNGRGFLFDEHWRLTAELRASRWDNLIGACNGLLCFLEAGQDSIKIIEPFTGESLALPQPPKRSCTMATSKTAPRRRDRPLATKNCTFAHWPTRTYVKSRRHEKLARFDLATEKITSKATMRLRLDPPRPQMALFCRLVESTPCVMTYGSYCEWDVWYPEAEEGGAGRCFPGGRVLLSDWIDHGLYLHTIEKSLEFSQRTLLFEVGTQKLPGYKYNGRASFVPARRHQQLPIPGAPPSREQCYARTFGYAPTVSAAPLALYLGTPSP